MNGNNMASVNMNGQIMNGQFIPNSPDNIQTPEMMSGQPHVVNVNGQMMMMLPVQQSTLNQMNMQNQMMQPQAPMGPMGQMQQPMSPQMMQPMMDQSMENSQQMENSQVDGCMEPITPSTNQ